MREKIKDVKILAVTEEGYDAGFKLAGCVTKKVRDERELIKLLDEVIGNGTYGIVIVEESLYIKIEERKRRKFEELPFPLIIGLNLKPEGRIEPEERIRELTRRAIGYTLRLK